MKFKSYTLLFTILYFNAYPQQPQSFLEQLLSDKVEYGLTITPDKNTIYFVKTDSFYVTKPKAIYKSVKSNGVWSRPIIASFSTHDSDSSPFVSPDGKKLFFTSRRPVNGKQANGSNIWYVDLANGNEGEPKFLKEVNSETSDYSPTTDKSGNLYFGSYRDGGLGSGDLWWSEFKNGVYQKPQNLGSKVNSKFGEWGSCISPDGMFLIFENSGKANNLSPAGDLYISHKFNGEWQEPFHFDEKINSIGSDLTPKIHDDILYFASNRPKNNINNCNNVDLYIISVSKLLDNFNNNNWSKTQCGFEFKVGNGITFLPDTDIIVISKPTGELDKLNKNQYSIFKLSFNENGSHSESKLDILSSEYTDYHPVISPDGKYLAFNSTRPNATSKVENGKTNIWISTIENGSIQTPNYVETINSDFNDSYPSFTIDNRIYFNSDRPGGKGNMDIYVSDLINGQWQKPMLIEELNSVHSENDLVVDPEERFIIFNRYISKTNEIDLFISYNTNGEWSTPSEIKSINKPNVWELTPTLSLNGEYLYLEINGEIKCYPTRKFLKK
jgi:hypothetical protein